MAAPIPNPTQLNLLEAAFLFGVGSDGKLRAGHDKYLRVAAVLQVIIMGMVVFDDDRRRVESFHNSAGVCRQSSRTKFGTRCASSCQFRAETQRNGPVRYGKSARGS